MPITGSGCRGIGGGESSAGDPKARSGSNKLNAGLYNCSIKQTVTPAEFAPAPEICLIPAEGLREGFNTTYTNLLKTKGFQIRQLASNSLPSACSLSTTYVGTWNWDLLLYMS